MANNNASTSGLSGLYDLLHPQKGQVADAIPAIVEELESSKQEPFNMTSTPIVPQDEIATVDDISNALTNTVVSDQGTVGTGSSSVVNTTEAHSNQVQNERKGTTAQTTIEEVSGDEEVDKGNQRSADLAYADNVLNKINGKSFKYQRYEQADAYKAALVSSGIALLGAAIARNKGEDGLAGQLAAGAIQAAGSEYQKFSEMSQRSDNIGQLEAEGYIPEAIQQYVNDGKTESLIASLHDNPFIGKYENNVRRASKGDKLADNSIATADGEYETIYGFDVRGNRYIDSVVYKGDPLEATRIKEDGSNKRHQETKAIELAKLRLLEAGLDKDSATVNSPFFTEDGGYVEAGSRLPNGQKVVRSGWYKGATDGTSTTYNLAKVDHKADETYNESKIAYASKGEALNLIKDILVSGESNAAGRAISGVIDSNSPILIPEHQILQGKIQQLSSLLTVGNLDKMSGVLSETDVKILREAALVLNSSSAWETKVDAMKRAGKQLVQNRQAINQRFNIASIEPGHSEGGYIFLGGDVDNKDNWAKQR